MSALEELTIDRRLLALPYKIELTPEGQIVMTTLHEPAPTWEELATTNPILPEDLHWKVETNGRNQIIMSPPPHLEHQSFSGEIIVLLSRYLPDGRAMPEAGVRTSDGTRIPDVVWVSVEAWKRRGKQPSFQQAPEICVEILSPSNNKREIDEKKRLYLEAGAQEVWICDRAGKMTFFGITGLLRKSRACPGFPERLNAFS